MPVGVKEALMNRVVGILVAVVAVFGMKFYNKSSSAKEVRTHFDSLCDDAQCKQALAAHFDACFDSAYKMGGRRKSATLEAGQLVQCLNAKAGKEYFSYNDKEQ
jgi:hypothetical protein